jgi:hypothetical protein
MQVNEIQKVEPQCRIYILGCKADLVQPNQGTQARARDVAASERSRCVTKEQVAAYCESVHPEAAVYFETSALTGVGVLAAFERCCRDWLAKPKRDDTHTRASAISLDLEDKKKKKTAMLPCCNQ